MTINYPTASPAKLRDGSWGSRVDGTAKPGDIVQVTTRAGDKTWLARVTAVIWTGEDRYRPGVTVSLCETESVDAPREGPPDANFDTDDDLPF